MNAPVTNGVEKFLCFGLNTIRKSFTEDDSYFHIWYPYMFWMNRKCGKDFTLNDMRSQLNIISRSSFDKFNVVVFI